MLKDKDGKLVADNKKIAEILNEKISVFPRETTELLPIFNTRTKVKIDIQKFSTV